MRDLDTGSAEEDTRGIHHLDAVEEDIFHHSAAVVVVVAVAVHSSVVEAPVDFDAVTIAYGEVVPVEDLAAEMDDLAGIDIAADAGVGTEHFLEAEDNRHTLLQDILAGHTVLGSDQAQVEPRKSLTNILLDLVDYFLHLQIFLYLVVRKLP